MRKTLAALLLAGLVGGCFGAPDKPLADKIVDGVAHGCAFKLEYQWAVRLVTSGSITAATVDNVVNAICEGVRQSQSTMALKSDCKYGYVMTSVGPVCIEGEPLEKPVPR